MDVPAAESARKRKVLIIDDSEISLEFAALLLTQAGYEVRYTTCFADFDETVQDWCPDAILTDVEMPGISGVELCNRLKARYDTAHVPVILFSSMAEDALRERVAECGADGFVSKSKLSQLPQELDLVFESLIW